MEGEVHQPTATLYAVPPMSDGDTLSYLLTGSPLSSATSSDAQLLVKAASQLGLKQGNALAHQIAGAFGLDTLDFSGDASARTATVTLGKYLSPRLYIGYGLGLFGQGNAARLRYKLGRRWEVEAESGNATGADLLYSIER